MSREAGSVLFVESNSTGTGRLFARACRALGYRPVLLTARPETYPHLSCDDRPDVVIAPTSDQEALAALVGATFRNRTIAGITTSSERFVAAAASLAERFGLPGLPPAVVRAARDKSWQRIVLAAAGIATPRFRVAGSPEEAAVAARHFGLPVVLKPIVGTGSAGVRACRTIAQVREQATLLVALAGTPPRFLVESLVTGPEFSVEVFGGRVVGLTRKHLGSAPYFVEVGHDYPASVTPAVSRALRETVVRATALLGLGWGPLHWELRMHAGRAVVMEVNPRLAGGMIPELVRHAEGIDLLRETVRAVVGARPAIAPERHRHAAIRFLVPSTGGRLLDAGDSAAASRVRDVVEVAMYRSPGDAVAIHHDFRDRIGHVIACADEPAAAARAAMRGCAAMRIVVAPATGTPAVNDLRQRGVEVA